MKLLQVLQRLPRVLWGIALTALLVSGCYRENTIGAGWPDADNLEKWKEYLPVHEAAPGEALGTTQNQISNVSPQLASAKMLQAMESYDAVLDYRLTSVFTLGQVTSVVVQGRQYYIGMLDYPKNTETRASFVQTQGLIPAIAVVDAQDETKPAWIRTQDEHGNAYAISLRFTGQELRDPGTIGWFLYNNGYTSYSCYEVDDPTLEVDDNWRPYFTATYVGYDACGPGELGDGKYATKLLVTDAQSRELTAYNLDDPNTRDVDERDNTIPAWADRIYSEELILDQIAYWGYNQRNYKKTSTLDWFRVDGHCRESSGVGCNSSDTGAPLGNLDLVMNRAGTNLVYIAYITSMLPDNSVVGVMLIDPRTAESTIYWTKSAAEGMATKSAAQHTIWEAVARNADDNLGVEDLTLHTIFGVRTWEGVLTRPALTNDGRKYGSLYAGTVLLQADNDLRPAEVVWANTLPEAFALYEAQLYLSQGNRPGSNVLEDKELTGVVSKITMVVVGGNTSYLIHLQDTKGVWEVRVQSINDPKIEDIFEIEVGDSVYLRYGDPHSRKTYLTKEVTKRERPATPVLTEAAPATMAQAPQ